jgi:hypothetical protein
MRVLGLLGSERGPDWRVEWKHALECNASAESEVLRQVSDGGSIVKQLPPRYFVSIEFRRTEAGSDARLFLRGCHCSRKEACTFNRLQSNGASGCTA